MLVVIFNCADLFCGSLEKPQKSQKLEPAKKSCHTVLPPAALKKKNRVPLLKVTCQICTVSVNKTCNSLSAVGKVEKLAKLLYFSFSFYNI